MSNPTNTTDNIEIPWSKPWPASGLESISNCPVCGQSERKVLHSDLVDNVFRTASGKWTLWQCAKCDSAYLDPRPTVATIHLAYINYYTHREVVGKESYSSLRPLRKLRRRLVNGYTNWRFGTKAAPASGYGFLTELAIPKLKLILGREYRHLPKLPKQGGRLLDVGCGDGSFLDLARTCGWDVCGLDPDPEAVANATKRNLTVLEGDIEYFSDHTEQFDVITLNHVIEHVHDPIKVLKICFALLKPGGQIWLETPNVDSFGRMFFKKNWRGLEAPRHLVLFNQRSLAEILISAGFMTPQNQRCPSPCIGMFRASFALLNGYSPYQLREMPWAFRIQAKLFAFAEKILPQRREFLTVTAIKAT